MDIFEHRANNVSPSVLLKNYKSKHNLYEPSKIDPRVYNEINSVFFDTVSGDFECIELSPICPFGLNASLTNTNQNNVLSSVRNSEVISDSSISMALECAYRIKELNTSPINLASSTRLLRTQNYGNGKKTHWSQHFRDCSLVSSFRIVENILCILKEKHQNVNFNLQLNRKSGLTYYDDVCYEIEVQFKNGKSLVLVDGGINNWTGKILSDAKEKCVTSGMGLEYIGKVYKKKI